MSSLLGCCGMGDIEKLSESIDSKQFSPIMNLDSYVADWAYAELKEQHEVETGCLSCSKFPKRSDVKITVNWSKVDFKHSTPDELKPKSLAQSAAVAEDNGNESDQLITKQNGGTNNIGYDANNDKVTALHQETFSVKYDNTTDKECSTTLSAARTVKASYEVDVHTSVQTGHNLQLAMEVGEDTMCKVEGSYEFNKMLENYKGEKRSEEQETTLNTEVPVVIPAGHTTEAKITTTYQNFKKTLHIKSEFTGTIMIGLSSKKRGKNGKKFYRSKSGAAFNIFKLMLKEEDSPLRELVKVDIDNQVVSYTSSATFCSSIGADQHVEILRYPIVKS